MTTTTSQSTEARGGNPALDDRPGLLRFLLMGMVFGIVLTKSEVISWYRIQEMFRFQSFHMYGVLGSAVAVGAFGMFLLRLTKARTTYGAEITVLGRPMTPLGTRYWLGGGLFGIGWAFTGACPGPLYALVGSGATAYLAVIASALVGVVAYGKLRRALPH